MSWSPYASDYSRYLPVPTSKKRVALFALAGGAVSSFAVEGVGALVGSLTASQVAGSGAAAYFAGLYSFAGGFGILAMLTMILGAFAADALNLYTNSLSALVLDIRASRAKTVAAGAVVGFVIAAAAGATFESFFENFLLVLSYWIMPWLAIVLVDFYVSKRTTPGLSGAPPSWDWSALGIYAISFAASIPFMNLSPYGPSYVGPLASALGGADLSYFFSFAVAAVLTWVVRMRSNG
jgi:NCS1 family nucleobase:cation symporter-1